MQLSLAVGMAMLVGKVSAYLLTGSAAILSDALESVIHVLAVGSINPTASFLVKLAERGIDVYTFLDRKCCCPLPKPSSNWVGEGDNVGLLEIKDYNSWLQAIG